MKQRLRHAVLRQACMAADRLMSLVLDNDMCVGNFFLNLIDGRNVSG